MLLMTPRPVMESALQRRQNLDYLEESSRTVTSSKRHDPTRIAEPVPEPEIRARTVRFSQQG
jgi:hypothetical protein